MLLKSVAWYFCQFGEIFGHCLFKYCFCSSTCSNIIHVRPFHRVPYFYYVLPISSVQLLSHIWLFVTPWTAARQASLSITNSRNLPKLMYIESMMPSNHLILFHPLLLPPSIFPSIRVFSNESALCIRWPKYWSFSFNIRPSNEHPGLISFRMDWLDLLAVQGTLKSLLKHHSVGEVMYGKTYMTTGKTIDLTSTTYHFFPWSFKMDLSSFWFTNHCLLLRHFSRVRLCVTPEMAAPQAPLSLGFPRQEHWSGLPFPSPMHESEKWKWSRSVLSDS